MTEKQHVQKTHKLTSVAPKSKEEWRKMGRGGKIDIGGERNALQMVCDIRNEDFSGRTFKKVVFILGR